MCLSLPLATNSVKRHIVRVVRVDVNGILSIVEQTQTMPPRVCVKHFPGPTSTAPICEAK